MEKDSRTPHDPFLDVIIAVTHEMRNQNEQHGRVRDIPTSKWISILGEEVGEVCEAEQEGDVAQAEREFIQVAAVAMQAAMSMRIALLGIDTGEWVQKSQPSRNRFREIEFYITISFALGILLAAIIVYFIFY